MRRGWRLAFLLAWLAASPAAAALRCYVKYGADGGPLLFGGTYDPGRCVSRYNRCQPRDDAWGKLCAYRWSPGAPWGTCSPEQSTAAISYAQRLGGGAPLALSPCHLVQYLRRRTLWVLGDSHSKDLYRALQCFLLDFWDHQECLVSPDAGANAQLAAQPERKGLSNCIHLLGRGGGRVCLVEVVLGSSLVNTQQVASGGVLPLLRQKFASPQDIFVVNFGSWHRDSYAGRKRATYTPALHSLGAYYAATKAEWPHLLFRESVAAHGVDTAAKACRPAKGYAYDPGSGRLLVSAAAAADARAQWELGAPLAAAVRQVLPGYGLAVVPGFNATVPLHAAHVAGQGPKQQVDCSHYCQIGVPQMLLWFLYKAFASGAAGIQPLTSTSTNRSSSGRMSRPDGAAGQQRQQPGRYSCVPSPVKL